MRGVGQFGDREHHLTVSGVLFAEEVQPSQKHAQPGKVAKGLFSGGNHLIPGLGIDGFRDVQEPQSASRCSAIRLAVVPAIA